MLGLGAVGSVALLHGAVSLIAHAVHPGDSDTGDARRSTLATDLRLVPMRGGALVALAREF